MQNIYTISYRILLFVLLTGVGCKNVYSQLKADFSAQPREGCVPMIINFTDSSSGSPTSWKWDLGNGTISNLQNPGATYFNPGKYTIKLVISDGITSDSVVKTNYIIVHGAPAINFKASANTGCYPLSVQFTDLTSPSEDPIIKWEWFFGDGGYSTDRNPLHVYKTSGNFDVTLRITTAYNCENTFTRIGFISVPKGVLANFSFINPNDCKPPTSISFTNSSSGTGQISYLWRFGDGTTSQQAAPTHVYNNSGSYTVTLVASNSQGCTDSMVKANAISIGNIDAGFQAPDSVCTGQSFHLTNTSIPAPLSVQWDFGDGTKSTDLNPVKSYAAPGTYKIQLISNFGACNDNAEKSIAVLPKAKSDFTAIGNIGCSAPLSVSFTQTATNAASFKWLFGDGSQSAEASPTHVYTLINDTAFDVTLISYGTNGCPDTIVKPKFVKIFKPGISLNNNPVKGCAPLTYKPVLTITSLFPITSIKWDFGDGSTSDVLSPTHVYNDTGLYTVKIIYTAANCTDSMVFQNAVAVGMKPVADFSASPLKTCAFKGVSFKDLSTGVPVDEWLWSFGDNGTSTEQNPAHFYSNVGDFDITLIVKNHGCSDTLKRDKYIHIDPPISKFTVSLQCTFPYVRKFTDKSIGPKTWLWDFGDGQTSTEQNPEHTYTAPGTYTVALTVSNDTCKHTSQQTIKVVNEIANFIAQDSITCKKSQVKFSTVNVTEQNISRFAWTFGDGFTSSVASPVKAYAQAGSYTVQLTLTDILGCQSTLTKPMYIKVNGPTANFSVPVSGICNNNSIAFTDLSTSDGENNIVQWKWDFGDGTIQSFSGPPFSHLYTKAGTYNVTLITVDAKSCTDTFVKKNAILVSQPVANFIAKDSLLCSTTNAEFINRSTGPQLTYLWNFGDGTTATDAFPEHNYPNEGSYTVALKIIDVYGCKDSLTKINYINIKNPVAKFTVSSTLAECPPLVASFNNQSQNYSSVIWKFGTGDSSTVVNPVYIYSYPGKYNVTLTVKGYGTSCYADTSALITVLGPRGTFKYEPLKGCEPFNVTFTALPEQGFKVTYIWDFNDGTLIQKGDSLTSHTYTDPRNYIPKMILVDDRDCRVPITGKDTIVVYGVKAAFTKQPTTLCDSGMVTFTNNSVANDLITQYQWDFGDGSSSTENSPSHFYTSPGNYLVKLSATTQNGCSDDTTSVTPVIVNQGPQITIQSADSACVPATIQFKGISVFDTMQLNWQWNFGNGQTSTEQNPPAVNYTAANTYNVQLKAFNKAGCPDTALKNLPVYAVPNIDAGADDTVCLGNNIVLHVTGGYSYNWEPAQGLSCTDCSDPVANPQATTWYYVTGKSIHACVNKDSVKIEVKQPITLQVSPGDSLCQGASMQLNASGAEIYTWSPVDGLSNAQISNPVASPTKTTNYMVIGTDSKSCFADTGYALVNVFPVPIVNAGNDTTIAVGNSVTLHPEVSDDATTILWQPSTGLSCANCKNPVAAPKQTTTYTITATNNGGCYSIDQVTVLVICKEGNVFLPNTFSPNNDGVNDIFYPRGKGLNSIRSMKIYNRWGQIVFSRENFTANDAGMGWDGKFLGKTADEGVYIFTIEIICENSQIILQKGNVALIR